MPGYITYWWSKYHIQETMMIRVKRQALMFNNHCKLMPCLVSCCEALPQVTSLVLSFPVFWGSQADARIGCGIFAVSQWDRAMHRDRGKGGLANILHQIHTPRAPHTSPCQNVSLKIRLECNKTSSLNDTVSLVLLHSLLGLKRKCLFPFLQKCYTSSILTKFFFAKTFIFVKRPKHAHVHSVFLGFQPRFLDQEIVFVHLSDLIDLILSALYNCEAIYISPMEQ